MRTYLRQILAIPRVVKILILTEVLLAAAAGVVSMEQNFLLREKGFTSGQTGSILSIGMLAAAVFALAAGFIGDRFGYKFSMITGGILKSAAIFMMAFGNTFGVLAVARALYGIGDTMIYVCLFPYLISFVEGPLKSMVYTLMFSAQTIAVFCGDLLAGALPKALPSYSVIVLIPAVAMAAVAVMRIFLPKPAHELNRVGKPARAGKSYLKERFVIAYYLYDFFGYTSYMISFSMVNLICRDSFHMTDDRIGYLIGSVALISGALLFVVPAVTKRLNRYRLNTGAILLLILIYPLCGLSSGLLFAVLIVSASVLQYIMGSFIDGPILERIPDTEKSGFTGLKMLMNYLGFALGNYAAGWFLESGKGYSPIYYTAAALAFIQLFIYVGGLMGPMEKGREDPLPAPREATAD